MQHVRKDDLVRLARALLCAIRMLEEDLSPSDREVQLRKWSLVTSRIEVMDTLPDQLQGGPVTQLGDDEQRHQLVKAIQPDGLALAHRRSDARAEQTDLLPVA